MITAWRNDRIGPSRTCQSSHARYRTGDDWPLDVLATLHRGAVIPAHPLALDANRKLDVAPPACAHPLLLDAGAGGLAVGVHTTQFAIREAGLYRPVLELAMRTAADWAETPQVMIAGLVGPHRAGDRGSASRARPRLSRRALSLAAMKGASEDELIAHAETVAREIPLVGFYLQPAVGGIVLPVSFWRRFAAIENVVAIKIAPFNRYRTLDVDARRGRGRRGRSHHALHRQRRSHRARSGDALRRCA